MVQGMGRIESPGGLSITEHIDGNASMKMLLGTNTVNGLLHFAVTTIAALHRIGGCRKHRVVQKYQRLFQIGREQFAQCLANPTKTPHSFPQLGQFGQSRLRAATTVEQTINLVHDFAEHAQMRQPTGDPSKCSTFCRSQVMGHKQMPMLEQSTDLRLQAFIALSCPLGLFGARTATSDMSELK